MKGSILGISLLLNIALSAYADSMECEHVRKEVEHISKLAEEQKHGEVKELAFEYLERQEECLSSNPKLLHDVFTSILSIHQGVEIEPSVVENILELATANVPNLVEDRLVAEVNIKAYEISFLIDSNKLEKAENAALNLIELHGDNPALIEPIDAVHMELSKVYIFQRKLNSAQKHVLKAIELHLSSGSEDDISLGWNYNALGAIYFYQGKYGLAEDAFLKTISTWTRKELTNHSDIADIYLNLSFVAKKFESDDRIKSTKYLEQAIDVLESDAQTAKSRLARIHIELAENYKAIKEDKKAEPHFKAFGRLYNFSTAKLTDMSGHASYINYLFERGQIDLAFGWFSEFELIVSNNDLPEYVIFSSIDAIIKHLAENEKIDEASTWMSIRTNKLVNYLRTLSDDRKQAIDFLKGPGTKYFIKLLSELTLRKLEKPESYTKEDALNTFIQMSSLVMQPETLFSLQTGIESQKDDEARAVNLLLSKKSRLFSRVSVGNLSISELSKLNAQIGQINQQLLVYSNDLSPQSLLNNPPSLNSLQSIISDDSSIFQFVTSLNDNMAVLHITKDDATYQQLSTVDSNVLNELTKELSQSIGQEDVAFAFELPEYKYDLAHELTTLIFEGVTPRKNLIIIASDNLVQLPFESLIVDYELTPNGQKQPVFLIDVHTLQYSPSLSLVKDFEDGSGFESVAIGAPLLAKETNPIRSSQHLTLSNSLEDNVELVKSLGYLANARQELESFNNLLPNSQVLIGSDATKKQAMSVLKGRKKIVAFSTHAITASRPGFPAISSLVLTPDTSVDDGLLSSEEIESLGLTADLVVLAACDTAMSDDGITYDMSGLAASFLKAGSKRVLVTTRSVGDEATFILITEFYRNLSSGYAAALQKGIDKLKKDQRYKHPFFWGAFRLVGVPDIE